MKKSKFDITLLKTLKAYSNWTRKLQSYVKNKPPEQLTVEDVREFMGNNIPNINEFHTHYPELSIQKWVVLLS